MSEATPPDDVVPSLRPPSLAPFDALRDLFSFFFFRSPNLPPVPSSSEYQSSCWVGGEFSEDGGPKQREKKKIELGVHSQA